MALSLADSNRIMAAAIAQAEDLNIKVSVAVVDAGGRLIGLQRMDGAIWASGLRLPGQGGGVCGVWAAQRRNAGPGHDADAGGHPGTFGFRNDFRTGRGTDHRRRRGGRRVRSWRGHERGG